MVGIGISEFSFGYAFLYEQTVDNQNRLRAAPILPSLQQEAEVGWDARLPIFGTDYYYQFKLSDYLSRSNASFIRDGTYAGPYYRIAIHRNHSNRQHQRLKELSRDNPNTFYVAPEFDSIDEFNSAFLDRNITSQSRLIPLTECKEIDDSEQHYITYQRNDEDWILHSNKKFHRKSVFGKNILNFYEKGKSYWKPIDHKYTTNLFNNTSNTIFKIIDKEERIFDKNKIELLKFDPHQATIIQTLIKTSQLLSIFFGVVLVVVGEK